MITNIPTALIAVGLSAMSLRKMRHYGDAFEFFCRHRRSGGGIPSLSGRSGPTVRRGWHHRLERIGLRITQVLAFTLLWGTSGAAESDSEPEFRATLIASYEEMLALDFHSRLLGDGLSDKDAERVISTLAESISDCFFEAVTAQAAVDGADPDKILLGAERAFEEGSGEDLTDSIDQDAVAERLDRCADEALLDAGLRLE